VRPKRPSGRRFAAFIAALGLTAGAFGAVALPRLADESVPASLKAKQAPIRVQEKLADHRCGRDRELDSDGDVFDRAVDAAT
jgi:hypothetical protein